METPGQLRAWLTEWGLAPAGPVSEDDVARAQRLRDALHGLAKAAAFGFVIALMGSWCGYRSKGGAQGVGQATTTAVVASSILILMMDYLLTEAFFAQ